MKETQLIGWLTRLLPRRKGNLKTGIGDDCSVIRIEKKDILISCDSLVEDVHFKRQGAGWHVWGAKAANTALSDIAAMGGTPRFAWINLAIPGNISEKALRSFYAGFQKQMSRFGAVIAGGNITRSPKGLHATTTVWGEAPAGKAMLRSRARPGDTIFVGGVLGKKTFAPEPQIKLGQQLLRRGCRCCIDVSDGLLKDLGHIANASGVQIVLEADKIPHVGELQKALTRGEDYLLAFTWRPETKDQKLQTKNAIPIGWVQKGPPGVQVLDFKGHLLSFAKTGFEHRMGNR